MCNLCVRVSGVGGEEGLMQGNEDEDQRTHGGV